MKQIELQKYLKNSRITELSETELEQNAGQLGLTLTITAISIGGAIAGVVNHVVNNWDEFKQGVKEGSLARPRSKSLF